MNRISILFVFLLFAFSVNAQLLHVPTTPLKNENEIVNSNAKEYTLKNGLKVYLFPDESMNDVMGAIVVRGGARLDPKGAEGTAHYFEHMMFKGSENLGTIDYKSEKVYLDSISETYDLLALAGDDEVFRNGLLKKIDRLSQKAAQYAIPNEFNKVMASIGSTRLNAYTTYEDIVYHNHFPAESMEQWMRIQVDRFSFPVFRLFQSELETVYEEKNMSMDNTFRNIFVELYKNFYPNSVYGQQTVLGSVEDLKTPSISKMVSYFKNYYVANNMALILVGNFQIDDVKHEIDRSFGKLRSGRFPEVKPQVENAFDGRVVVKKKMSPIPIGILGFRTVAKGDKDDLILQVINQLLSNEQSTGLLDQLSLNGKLMFAQSILDVHYDMGASFIAYAPKPFIQSLKSGEKLVLEQIDILKRGEFSDDLLKAVLVQKQKEISMGMEAADFQTHLIIDAFMSKQQAEAMINNYKLLQHIGKQDIVRVANKYYGDDYLMFQSKMGFPKKMKIDKPDITPLKPQNLNKQSVLAQSIANMPEPQISPNYIKFKKDVLSGDLYSNLHFYYTKNKLNDIYSLRFKIGVGTYTKKELQLVSEYLNLSGTKDVAFKDFRTSLQLRGTDINTSVDESYFYIDMTGFDSNIEQDIRSLRELLSNTEENQNALKKIMKDANMEYKLLKSDLSMQSKALHEYAVYGKESEFLTKMSTKEIKSMKIESVLQSIKELLSYEAEIHFVGKASVDEVRGLVTDANIFAPMLQLSKSPVYRALPALTSNKVYFMNNKKAVQSHIKITLPSEKASIEDRQYINAFNKYFGLGMSSMAFREIREYRSLAYGVYAYINKPFKFSDHTYLFGAMTTQADKTNESISVFLNVIDSMPKEDDSFEQFKKSLLLSVNSKAPTFRNQSQYVAYWMRQGYNEDPRIQMNKTIQRLSLLDLNEFHSRFVLNHKYVLSVVGDAKRINMEQFKSNLGDYTVLKFKSIYKK